MKSCRRRNILSRLGLVLPFQLNILRQNVRGHFFLYFWGGFDSESNIMLHNACQCVLDESVDRHCDRIGVEKVIDLCLLKTEFYIFH